MSESQGSSAAIKGCIVVIFLGGVVGVFGAAGLWVLRGDKPETAPLAAPPAPAVSVPGVPTVSGAALDRIRARGKLLVAMDTGEPAGAGTPPMFFVDAQGGRDGFDYALSRRIAESVGVHEVEIVHAKYSGLEELLLDEAQRADILVFGYVPTGTPGITWSTSYLEFGLCLVVATDSKVATLADLFGKPVGIFDDDAAAEDVQKLVKGYTELVRLEDGYWDALAAGRFAGFLYDYPYAAAELRAWAAEDPSRAGRLRIAQYNLTDSTYAVGVRSAEADLRVAVDGAIATWRASDDYPAAVKRYLKGGEAQVVTDTHARKVVVKRGDTLSGIARREFGSTDRWTEIWALNRSRFPNPHLIEVGDDVILP